MRLNAYIAKCGFCSRRKADSYIREGRVTINKEIVRTVGYQVGDVDTVMIDKQRLVQASTVYFLFNKPVGVVTTVRDRHAQKKVTDFLPKNIKGIFPVGRLDKDSQGLLILTNDGLACHRATHPRFGIKKEYLVEVAGTCLESHIQKAQKGIWDDNELLRIEKAVLVKQFSNCTRLKVVVGEGKKRHLRRLFMRLGLPVTFLQRIKIGNISLGSLASGQFKQVTREMVYRKLGIATGQEESKQR